MSNSCKNCDTKDPKFKCGSCGLVWYCMKECQKLDWPKHKSECNKVSIVVVNGSETELKTVKKSELDESCWIRCEITEMIGVPIMVKRLGWYTEEPDRDVGIFLMVDPVTGLAANEWQTGCGKIAFALQDKKDLTEQLFWDVYSYIFHLMDFYAVKNFNYEKFRRQNLNYESFRTYQLNEHKMQEEYQKFLEDFKRKNRVEF